MLKDIPGIGPFPTVVPDFAPRMAAMRIPMLLANYPAGALTVARTL